MNNEKFNHNRILNCFKRFICFFSCFVLCICLIPYTIVFADSSFSNFTNNGWTYSLPAASSLDTSSGTLTVSNYKGAMITLNPPNDYDTDSDNIFSFDVTIKSISSSGYFRIHTTNTSKYYFSSISNNMNATLSNNFIKYATSSSQSAANDTYSITVGYDSSFNDDSGIIFDFYQSGTKAFTGSIEISNVTFSSSSSSSYSDTFTLNPGQVVYIGFPISAEYSITANTEMPKLSSGGSWDAPQRWGASDSLPTSGTSFPASGSSKIPWQVVGSTNMFSQGVSAQWSISNTLPVGIRFIYIYNPWYYQEAISSPSIYSSDGNLTINTNPITINVSNYSAIRIYNLQQSVTGEGVYISNSTSGFTDYTDVIPSEESGTGEVEYQQYVDGTASGDPSIINGTNNNQYNPNPMTVTEHIQQVTQVLSNFANSLIELIKAPISHVANLIQAGSGFMASLRGMYAWLPVDIQGLVTSALTLVIGIGVFKVFL